MKNLKLLIILFSVATYAQSELKFDKKMIHLENHWIAFPADSLGNHIFGFMYFDSQAGLTFDFAGSFNIDSTGKFVIKKKENTSLFKYRIEPNDRLVSQIPNSKLTELEVEEQPEWLKYYKADEEAINYLYNRGFLFNAWYECETALNYLIKAEKIDPNYPGLQTEIAYSYNALKKFDMAEKAILKSLKHTPNNCYSLKELAYTYQNQSKLKKSAEVYDKMKNCSEINYLQETAYNLAFRYYELKDIKNFKKWNSETRNLGAGKRFTDNLDWMEKEITK